MNRKKVGIYLLSVIMAASMVACGPTNVNPTVEPEVPVVENVEVVEEPEEVAEPEVEEEVVETFTGKYVKVGEEITMNIGDVIRVEGDDDYELRLDDLSSVNGVKKANFTQFFDDKELPLVWWEADEDYKETFQTDADYVESYGSFQLYPMTLSKIARPDVVFTLDSKVIIPEKIEFSGNADVIYNSSEYNYIETEHCFIYLDKDIDIPENLGVAVEDIIASLESLTGYEFKREGAYDDDYTVNTANVYIDCDPWYGVNADKNKIDVFVFADNGTGRISCASEQEIVLIAEDVFSKNNEIKVTTIAHELTHVLTLYNFSRLGDIMTEGIAEVYEYKVADMLKDKYTVTEWDTEKALGYLDSLAKAKDAEKVFIADYQAEGGTLTNLPYQYGLAFNTYLYETFGDDYLHKYEAAINEGRFYYEEPEEGVEASKLKEVFGDTLFTDFHKWYKENKARFEFPEY